MLSEHWYFWSNFWSVELVFVSSISHETHFQMCWAGDWSRPNYHLGHLAFQLQFPNRCDCLRQTSSVNHSTIHDPQAGCFHFDGYSLCLWDLTLSKHHLGCNRWGECWCYHLSPFYKPQSHFAYHLLSIWLFHTTLGLSYVWYGFQLCQGSIARKCSNPISFERYVLGIEFSCILLSYDPFITCIYEF